MNYMFLRDSQLVKWLDYNIKLYVFAVFLTGAGMNNLIPDNIMG